MHDDIRAWLQFLAARFVARVTDEVGCVEGQVRASGPAPYRRLDLDSCALAYVYSRPRKRGVRVDISNLWVVPRQVRSVERSAKGVTLWIKNEVDVLTVAAVLARTVDVTRRKRTEETLSGRFRRPFGMQRALLLRTNENTTAADGISVTILGQSRQGLPSVGTNVLRVDDGYVDMLRRLAVDGFLRLDPEKLESSVLSHVYRSQGVEDAILAPCGFDADGNFSFVALQSSERPTTRNISRDLRHVAREWGGRMSLAEGSPFVRRVGMALGA